MQRDVEWRLSARPAPAASLNQHRDWALGVPGSPERRHQPAGPLQSLTGLFAHGLTVVLALLLYVLLVPAVWLAAMAAAGRRWLARQACRCGWPVARSRNRAL
jgi:hypothetical protein